MDKSLKSRQQFAKYRYLMGSFHLLTKFIIEKFICPHITMATVN